MNFYTSKRQAGASLMEVLVSMSISLVVTAGMVALMSNSLGSTTRIIQMTKLTDDLRVAMQMMTRDVRRSSYNAQAMNCYGNEDCFTDGSIVATGDISISAAGDCFIFQMDRDHDGDSTENGAGGFRRVAPAGTGYIEMWTGGAAADCGAAPGAAGWVQITDPEHLDIDSLNIDDDLSYEELILNDGLGNMLSQKVRKIRINLNGSLVLDDSIVRNVGDIISVRNDLLFEPTTT